MAKYQKCSFCNLKYTDKSSLYDHIESKHRNLVPQDISIPQYVFNVKYKKEFGNCVICGKKTKWNEVAERYDRLCSEKCKEEYKKAFQKRMMDKHGKVYLTRDPEHQRKMLANRKISGMYKWSDGVSEVGYTGSYELDFLKFLDVVMNFNATDIISPAPQNFYYKDENGKERFYFPDFFIPSLNLIIEIKDGGDNPNKHHKIQEVDKKLEKIKDDIMRTQKEFNYVKVSNKDYSSFLTYLIDLKNHEPEKCKAPLIRINESGFDNLAKKLSKNNPYLKQEAFLESVKYYSNDEIKMYSDLYKHSLLEESINKIDEIIFERVMPTLDDDLIIEAEKDSKGNYIKPDFNNYALKEEKMYPLNNMNDFKRNIRNFKNCPSLHRKKLAESLVAYCEEHSQKIPESSTIWQYVNKKPHLVKKYNPYNKNDRYELNDLKFKDVQSYLEIDKVLNNANEIYLSSDYHLFESKRKNIFTSFEMPEINEVLIRNQRETVKSSDVFIFLGDLVDDEFDDKNKLIMELSKLSGYKILVLGNNDVFPEEFYYSCGFSHVVRAFKWNNFVFTHIPMTVPQDYINIHGHIHGSRSYSGCKSGQHIDVYCDLHKYLPISLKDALTLYNKGFYNEIPSYSDYSLENQLSVRENYSFDASIQKAREQFGKLRDSEFKTFELFLLMGRKRMAVITNTKNSSDNKGGYYAVNYGQLAIDDNYHSEESDNTPIYILGLRNPEIEVGSQVQVIIIGCVERADGTEILIGQYVHNKRKYTPLQISTLIYPQERHYEHELYIHDVESKITKIVDVEHELTDIHSDEFMSRLIESVNIDVEGNILLNLREKNNFMARYMTSHRLLKIYEQTGSIENIKYELCKLYYMMVIIETYYMKKGKENIITRALNKKNKEEALKARTFIINDFTRYMKLVLQEHRNFNFYKYFEGTDYYKDVIKITPDNIKGLKKLLQSIVF